MKHLLIIVAMAVGAYGFLSAYGPAPEQALRSSAPASQRIAKAYATRQSDIQVAGEGIVIRLLRDDADGSRHQRFILGLENGQTLLISHNIDLAPRIDSLREGDRVAFYGEYEWNAKGGVIHWTHRDPQSRHADGWLRHDGRLYQ